LPIYFDEYLIQFSKYQLVKGDDQTASSANGSAKMFKRFGQNL
jgi:hypothetical protein